MYESVVYQGEMVLGGVFIHLINNFNYNINELMKGIRISHFSKPSKRCSPLAVLHTVSSTSVFFKMESKTLQQDDDDGLFDLHSLCIKQNKTAVVPFGSEEIHLVAMFSRNNDRPCFWGFVVALGLYDPCLEMLNLRCLGIVFDLDETLIVANTMRSFEDKIEALQRKINCEVDPQRIAGMQAEVRRYLEDKSLLKQYAEYDQVFDNGKVMQVQFEVVQPLSISRQPIVRPLIRLQEKNIILTRINPQNRDTSVLVRLRPAWEDLRGYLTATGGRKRFEVYVCTMAERDYALEMWRLLDPDSNLINSKEQLDRIVCVKSGFRKSLFNVFENGFCHPKMALVIDDRINVWDEKDQPRVHVVPAFVPYYAPQAEASNDVPVLCVARNVACRVRGGFFKEFDDGLLQKISQIAYEDDIEDIPSPDVSSYLVSEDDTSASNGNSDPISYDGMAVAEVEKIIQDGIMLSASGIPVTTTNLDPRLTTLQYTVVPSVSVPPPPSPMLQFPSVPFLQPDPLVKPMDQVAPPQQSLHTSPEEGEVPESELDPDTWHRLLILQHGLDVRDRTSSEPSFSARQPMQVSSPRVPLHGGQCHVEEEIGSRQLNGVAAKECPLDFEALRTEKHCKRRPSLLSKADNFLSSDKHKRFPKKMHHRHDRSRLSRTRSSYHSFSGDDKGLSRSSSSHINIGSEAGHSLLHADTPVGVLQDIALKCGTKVEYRSSLVASTELQFCVEAWFSGKKIGEGYGRTRKEAQSKAAEDSLNHLANIYLSHTHDDGNGFPSSNDNRYVGDVNSLEGSNKSMGSISALQELCMTEGLGVSFQSLPAPASVTSAQKDEVYAQVEIDGQVFGEGIGLTWDEAKMQAAERALGNLRKMLRQNIPKRQVSPRSSPGLPSKRSRKKYSQSSRYPKNIPTVL